MDGALWEPTKLFQVQIDAIKENAHIHNIYRHKFHHRAANFQKAL